MVGMADVPGAGGREEDSLAITERYRIRQSTHRNALPAEYLLLTRHVRVGGGSEQIIHSGAPQPLGIGRWPLTAEEPV